MDIWIESHTSLARHPKTLRLAKLIGAEVPTVVGHLHLLWWWAIEYAQDGDLSGFSAEEIALACLWQGDAALFRQALEDARFLDPDGRIHDWGDYVGKLLDRRRKNTERMRVARGLPPATATAHASSSNRTRAPHVRRTNAARAGATQPNPTVPDPTQPAADSPAESLPVAESTEPDAAGPAAPAPDGRTRLGDETKEQLHALNRCLDGAPGYVASRDVLRKIGQLVEAAPPERRPDIEAEGLKLRAWLDEHPAKRCTAKFLLDWFERAVQPPPSQAGAEPDPPPRGTPRRPPPENLPDYGAEGLKPVSPGDFHRWQRERRGQPRGGPPVPLATALTGLSPPGAPSP